MTVIILALALSSFGGTAIILSLVWEKRKQIVSKFSKGFAVKAFTFAGVFIASLLVLGMFNKTYAQDLSMIKLEEPPKKTNSTELRLTYVAYDLSGADINVQCLVKKVGDPTYSIAVVDDNTLTSSVCTTKDSLNNSLILTNGDYEIKVVNGTKSAFAFVTIDRTAPSAPIAYSKVNPEVCKNRIDFVTQPDGGALTKVEIFRAETTTFTAGPTTFLETVEVISGNSGSSAVFTLPDCSKTYYYAIQAVDPAGNRSGFVGDIGTNVVYYTPTPTPVGTVNGDGTTNGTGGTGSGTGTAGVTVTPKLNPDGTVDTSGTDGLVAGTTDNNDKENANNNLLIIFIVIGAVILAGFVFEIKLKKPTV
jgi:hypothetical protein